MTLILSRLRSTGEHHRLATGGREQHAQAVVNRRYCYGQLDQLVVRSNPPSTSASEWCSSKHGDGTMEANCFRHRTPCSRRWITGLISMWILYSRKLHLSLP